jgi:hypothetical protein
MPTNERISQRHVIPDPAQSLDQYERFVHKDLDHLTPLEAWAERERLVAWLADAVFQKRRPKAIYVLHNGDVVADQDWVQDRLTRLQSRRAAVRAA